MQTLYIISDDPFAKKVIKQLKKDPKKSEGIVGIEKVPPDAEVSSPSFIDKIDENLPQNLPSSDIILAIGVGMYLQAIPTLADKTSADGVIVPIEDSSWYPPGTLNQVKRKLEKLSIEVAFPRPFCALEGKGRDSIREFVQSYEIGRPELSVDVKKEKINEVRVETTAPCGSTHTVSDRIEGTSVSFESSDILELEGHISKAHHSHPCTGDMMEDPMLGETILHRAGYLVRNAVKKGVGLDLDVEREAKTGVISEQCSSLCEECIESCQRSSTGILEIQGDEITIPNYKECNGCRSCVKACPKNVMGKLVTERDILLLEEWEDQKLSN